MKALILAGGFGTRMRPLTDVVPKSLLPIANRPFLEHQIQLLAKHGIHDVVLLTGYLPEEFGPFSSQMQQSYGVRVEISTEDKPLGTAGAVRSKLDELDGPTLVFNGDVLTDVDLTALLDLHRSKEAAVTIYLRPVSDATGYGVVPLDGDGRVLEFREKPPPEIARLGGLINAGTYVLDPRVLKRVPGDTFWQFEQNLFPELLADSEPMYGYPSEAYWLDIGTPERYLQANFDVLERKLDAALDGQRFDGEKTLADGTTLYGPMLLHHAPVGPGARLGPLVTIGPGVRIGARARVERSVLHEGAVIGEGTVVIGSIIGRGVQVDANAELIDAVIA